MFAILWIMRVISLLVIVSTWLFIFASKLLGNYMYSIPVSFTYLVGNVKIVGTIFLLLSNAFVDNVLGGVSAFGSVPTSKPEI